MIAEFESYAREPAFTLTIDLLRTTGAGPSGRPMRADDLDETVKATRRFARRQESWFRRDPRITWLDATADDLTDRALDVIAARPLR